MSPCACGQGDGSSGLAGHRRAGETLAAEIRRTTFAGVSTRPGALPSSPAPERPNRALPLEHFRSRERHRKIHPTELALLVIIATHLVFLPWALGSMHAWAQLTSLGFSLVGMTVALLNRTYTEEHTGLATFSVPGWPRLLRFPLFWLGLVFLGLVTAQGLNPAWSYRTDGKGWWMEATPFLSWLPSGVEVPFERGGPWRQLIIYASAWLTVCAIWLGFTRRRSVQLLLTVLALNGVLLAAFGLVQKLAGGGRVFWLSPASNTGFFSAFFYKNHASAYLNLVLAAATSLAAWYYVRGLRRLEKSNPSAVFAFFAICIGFAIVISYSRGATLIMLGFSLLCIGAFIVHYVRLPPEFRKPAIALGLLLVLGFSVRTGFEALNTKEAWDRMKSGINRDDESLLYRERASTAAWEMLQEKGLRGVGAGGFAFVFPIYQHRHPDLVAASGRPMFWEHAHNDLLEIPIDLGLAGVCLLLGAAGYWLLGLTRNYFWSNPLSAGLMLGVLFTVIHARWEFVFQCPAILITWCACWPVATLWAQFTERPSPV